MAPERAPAFQFYPKDFLTDGNVAVMSMQERGCYITLLCTCWLEQSLPSSHDKLSKLVGLPIAAFRKVWPAIQPCFIEADGRLTHKRLEIEREKQEIYRRRQSDAGRASANRRLTAVQPRFNQKATG